MIKVILVLNAGASRLKFCFYALREGELELMFGGQFEGLYTRARFTARNAKGAPISEKTWDEGLTLGHEGAIEHLRHCLREQRREAELAGVGHRVAHGGTHYGHPVRLDGPVLAGLEQLTPLAPTQQPHSLMPIGLLLKRMPEVPQVACFDTAFHRSNPSLAQMFGLPQGMTEAGVRRYGFHGLSYEYIASVLAQRVPPAAQGKTVVLHLGNSSSLCALEGGRSLCSTMGFSALDGLPMGTRCGALDPGVLLFLLQQKRMDAAAIEKLLYKESGLLGVSGISGDVRELLGSAEPRAKLALDFFIYRIGRELGSLAAALGGVEALVFTAGVGENAVWIRERVCRDAAWLGVELDTSANIKGGPCISTPESRVQVWVLKTDEELMIARHTVRLLGLD